MEFFNTSVPLGVLIIALQIVSLFISSFVLKRLDRLEDRFNRGVRFDTESL